VPVAVTQALKLGIGTQAGMTALFRFVVAREQ